MSLLFSGATSRDLVDYGDVNSGGFGSNGICTMMAWFRAGDDEMKVETESRKLWEYEVSELIGRGIRTGNHCFGCTAGTGSSCTGALS